MARKPRKKSDASLRPWRRVDAQRLHRCRVFDLDRVRFLPPGGDDPRDFFVVSAPDWINVIPLTGHGTVVMVRQYRFGVERFTLEIPGGMCDGEESPEEAARRELLEETGYTCDRLEPLGWVHPNPAVQTNRCHTFLARDVRRDREPSPDPDEDLEVVEARLADVPGLIRDGTITHALVVCAFDLLERAGGP